MPPSNPARAQNKKSTALAYILWAIGGPWGLHHLYLGRPNQALLWWATMGGFMGFGWLRDICRIPTYVADANDDPEYLRWLAMKMRSHAVPPLSLSRVTAQFFFGLTVGVATVAGLPSRLLQGGLGIAVQCLVAPCAVGLAVYLIANIGREKSVIGWCLSGAYATVPLFILNPAFPASNLSHCAIASTIVTTWKGRQWRRTPRKSTPYGHYFIIFIAAFVYASLWCSCFYNNAYVTTSDGEKVKLRDAVHHIWDSQAWRQPLETMRLMWATYGANDFYAAWRELVNAMDPEGEMSAYQVLGVRPGATEKEIRKAYRHKSLQYHPDKSAAVDDFIAVQKAYDTLSGIQARRARANRQSRGADGETLDL